jgi:hypothetical protein
VTFNFQNPPQSPAQAPAAAFGAPTPAASFGQPAPAGGGGNPFAGLAAAKTWDDGGPKLPLGNYVVRIDKCLLKPVSGKQTYIAEYTVTESDNPAVEPGLKSGMLQGCDDIGMNYLVNWLYSVMGLDRNDKGPLPYMPYVALASTTGVDQPFNGQTMTPSMIVGKTVRLSVYPPKNPNKLGKNGQPFNHEVWSRV